VRRLRTLLALLLALTLFAAACGGDDDDDTSTATGDDAGESSEPVTLNIVGFAVPEAANKAIADEWNKTPEGEGVSFETSYGPSGDQSRAVEEGLDADYVHFSVTSDVTRLVDAGLVEETWDDGDNKGVVSTSVVVFAVRKDSDLEIDDWDDLVKPGVEIVTPNPASSGAARWNALAAWGHVIQKGGTEEEAEQFINDLYANAVALPSSGRDATQAFTSGTGNVFITYENEAILARQNGEDFDYVIPETTILIENPGAVLKDATPKAEQWLEFVLGAEGQRQFALKGFRPLGDPDGETVDFEVEGANDPSNPFPKVTNLLTVDEDFESWSALSDKFFDEENGIVVKAIAASGAAQ
jgi:sulfate/thiosulfate-binding protein